MFHSKEMESMKQDIFDLLKVGVINATAFVTNNIWSLESVLKYTLYFVSIVYTVLKITKMISDRIEYKKNKKKFNDEVKK